jgi:hypothetical protein
VSPRKEAGNAVQVKRLIRRHIRKSGSGIDLAADVNAVVSVNVNERGTTTSTTSTEPPTSSHKRDAGANDRGKENA